MKKSILLALGLIIGNLTTSFSQKLEIIPLGIYGGGDESNLSCYLIGVEKSNSYLSLDAGTVRSGLNKAIEKKTFDTIIAEDILRNYIKGYFISHGHLDHLSGLIINSPEDFTKPIYSLPFVVDVFKNNYFTNASWANFGNEGELPILNKYTYNRVESGKPFSIEGTAMIGEVFELSHVNPQKSSAILVKNNDEYILYFGDTGADRVEGTNNLNNIWNRIASLIKEKKLQTILIEVSFPNSQPENKLFGHLTPKLLVEELTKLKEIVGMKNLKGLNIVVTHLKPSGQAIETIKKELATSNTLEVNYIFPVQGEKIKL